MRIHSGCSIDNSGASRRQFLKTGADTGVGLAGMRERIREQLGQLEIESDETGTLVEVILPISVPSSVPEESSTS